MGANSLGCTFELALESGRGWSAVGVAAADSALGSRLGAAGCGGVFRCGCGRQKKVRGLGAPTSVVSFVV
jgi:hypothetical protein